jgi:hypothetical protein
MEKKKNKYRKGKFVEVICSDDFKTCQCKNCKQFRDSEVSSEKFNEVLKVFGFEKKKILNNY